MKGLYLSAGWASFGSRQASSVSRLASSASGLASSFSGLALSASRLASFASGLALLATALATWERKWRQPADKWSQSTGRGSQSADECSQSACGWSQSTDWWSPFSCSYFFTESAHKKIWKKTVNNVAVSSVSHLKVIMYVSNTEQSNAVSCAVLFAILLHICSRVNNVAVSKTLLSFVHIYFAHALLKRVLL